MARVVLELLTAHRVPHFRDGHGNVVVGAHDLQDYERRLAAPRPAAIPFFIAHMDHPGFHGVKWTAKKELLTEWLGGGPSRQLVGAKVWLTADAKNISFGTVRKANQKGRRIIELLVVPDDKMMSSMVLAKSVFGGFSFGPPLWKKGDLIFTKAADDLVGTYAIVEMAIAHADKFTGYTPFIGLLTRAEEVGYLGMIHHFQDVLCRRYQSNLFCVSLETSKALPGAEIGNGPVVRLGDRTTIFDPAAVEWITQVARKFLNKKFQRRIMDGGTCEATVANAEGYRAAGISVPLGNYHNECFFDKGAKVGLGGPAPEFVSWKDVQGLLKLCHALVANPFDEKRAWHFQLNAFSNYREQFQGKMTEPRLEF